MGYVLLGFSDGCSSFCWLVVYLSCLSCFDVLLVVFIFGWLVGFVAALFYVCV